MLRSKLKEDATLGAAIPLSFAHPTSTGTLSNESETEGRPTLWALNLHHPFCVMILILFSSSMGHMSPEKISPGGKIVWRGMSWLIFKSGCGLVSRRNNGNENIAVSYPLRKWWVVVLIISCANLQAISGLVIGSPCLNSIWVGQTTFGKFKTFLVERWELSIWVEIDDWLRFKPTSCGRNPWQLYNTYTEDYHSTAKFLSLANSGVKVRFWTLHSETHGCGKSSSNSATEVKELSRKSSILGRISILCDHWKRIKIIWFSGKNIP